MKKLKIQANGHLIEVTDWKDWSELRLDGFCLCMHALTSRRSLELMAKNLAFALEAPLRKKKPKKSQRTEPSGLIPQSVATGRTKALHLMKGLGVILCGASIVHNDCTDSRKIFDGTGKARCLACAAKLAAGEIAFRP